jgi:dienelactone hydrolase
MGRISFTNSNNKTITMAAVINFPDGFDEEDVSAVVDYPTTLPYVDKDRIGAMGICAGAGYSVNAAINDPRIQAVGTVSMVNIGQMFRNGLTGEVKSADAFPLLRMGADSRTAGAKGGELAQYPTAPGWATARSPSQIIPYDAFTYADVQRGGRMSTAFRGYGRYQALEALSGHRFRSRRAETPVDPAAGSCRESAA